MRRNMTTRSRKASAGGARDTGTRREGRLSAHDWIVAGQDLLRAQGISAMKLAALTARLGVSTGSFYHHFADFEQYLGALAESYSLERVMHDLEAALKDGDHSPVGRIRSLGRQSLKAGTFELDRAMRIWATMDPRAEAALRRAEKIVLDFITDAFAELGFPRQEAALRARILLSSNVSPLLPQGEKSHADFFRGCLQLMVADAPRADAAMLAEVGLAPRSAPRRRTTPGRRSTG
jgi:AcrR family transcriptional regulator